MQHKRFFTLSLLLVLALLVSLSAVAQEPIIIRMWTSSSSPVENEFKEQQIAAFEEANPDIDVELLISPDYGTQIQTAFGSGDYPEVFSVGQFEFPTLADSGVIAAGGDMIEDADGIYPALLNAFTLEDTAYCVPKDYSTLALFYNIDAFDAANLEYPTADWTWEDFANAAEALTNDEMTGVSLAPDTNRWLALAYANAGAPMFDEEGASIINSPEVVESLDFYGNLVLGGIANTPANLDSGWNGEAFGRGLAAMTIEGNWALGYLDESFPELNYGVAELPVAPSGNRGTLTFTECWAVGANAEGAVAEAAWKLVNYLTGEEGAAQVAEAGFGVMPARPTASEAWLEQKGEVGAAFVSGTEYAYAPVWPMGYADFNDVLVQGMNSVLNGNTSAQELLDEAAEVAAEIREELE